MQLNLTPGRPGDNPHCAGLVAEFVAGSSLRLELNARLRPDHTRGDTTCSASSVTIGRNCQSRLVIEANRQVAPNHDRGTGATSPAI